jgi:hypothetical protein
MSSVAGGAVEVAFARITATAGRSIICELAEDPLGRDDGEFADESAAALSFATASRSLAGARESPMASKLSIGDLAGKVREADRRVPTGNL